MGKYVNNGIVSIPDEHEFGSQDDILKELGTLLGVGKRSNGRRYVADVCQADSVNMWAKYKPVRHSTVANITETQRKSVNYGLDPTNAKISSTSDVTGIGAKYTDGVENGWGYLKPRGATYGEVSRIRDFDGYHHAALPFFGGMTIPNRFSKEEGNLKVSFIVVDGSSSGDLTHQDIPAITNCYIGAAFVAADGTTHRMTGQNVIASGGISLECPMSTIPAGNYTVYPFLSSIKMSFIDGNVGNVAANVYTLPNVNGKSLILAENTLVIKMTCYYTATLLHYTVNITNNSSSAKTLTNNIMRVRLSNKGWNDALEVGEVTVEGAPADPITVAAGATYTKSGTITVGNAAVRDDSRLWISLHGGNYITSVKPDQSITPNPTEV